MGQVVLGFSELVLRIPWQSDVISVVGWDNQRDDKRP